MAIDGPTNALLNFSGLYTKYIHWRKENDEVYIQSISVDDFKVFARDRNLYRFIRCHQIGIVWLLNFEDTDIESQSLLDNMTFYKYGGIRHAVFYYQQLHLINYQNMLLSFLQTTRNLANN